MVGSRGLLAQSVLIAVVLPHPNLSPRFATDKALEAAFAQHFAADWNAASGSFASSRHCEPHEPKWQCGAQRGSRLRHKADASRPQGLKNCAEGLFTVSQDEEKPRGDDSVDCARELLQTLRVGSQEGAISEARVERSGARAGEEAFGDIDAGNSKIWKSSRETSGVKTGSAANLNQMPLLTALQQKPKSIRDRFRMIGEKSFTTKRVDPPTSFEKRFNWQLHRILLVHIPFLTCATRQNNGDRALDHDAAGQAPRTLDGNRAARLRPKMWCLNEWKQAARQRAPATLSRDAHGISRAPRSEAEIPRNIVGTRRVPSRPGAGWSSRILPRKPDKLRPA
jgi:hypothetical protein